MKDIKSIDILSSGLNLDIIESIEKVTIKSNSATKEQKEKSHHDLFHTYLEKLNKTLKQNESAQLSDLVIEKSSLIGKAISISEWPGAETLKVADFHRLTIPLYNYNKHRHSKMKEIHFKAFENLAKFLEVLIELSSSEIDETLLFLIYNDIFSYYVMTRRSNNEENSQKANEDIFAIIDMIYEETSKI